jgi:16S rRNA (guanine527-N7)-methyltransferase
MNAEAFRAGCAQIGIDVTPAMEAAFDAFEEALYSANAAVNLTRIPREDCRILHFLDSLLFVDLLPNRARLLDIGTGPGFPAWPLVLARPDLRVTALDSAGKPLAFLREQAPANLACIQARAEQWGVREAFDVVTGRAVAPLAIQLELSAAPCRLGGQVMPMRTPSDLPEIERIDPSGLGLRLRAVQRRVLPGTDAVRVLPVYEKVGPTPDRYPRTWAAIKRKPYSP